MKKSFLFWGVIVFLTSGFLWFVSIIFNVVTFGYFRELSNVLGIITLSSLPAVVILAFGAWAKNKYFIGQKEASSGEDVK
ncbi:MAG: hypothetical protein Q8R36_04815 [bacterium]|nr:hypothetical protein [bacterium]